MAGNWKMYKTPAETAAFFEKLLPLVAASNHADVLVCPPFVNIASAVVAAAGSNVAIGGQNLHWAKEGAFTGEVSGPMLRSAGCAAVIVGHSERRQYFGETDATVLKRTVAALDAGLVPVVCVGEVLGERESGRTDEVLATQFRDGLGSLSAAQFARVVIAYEPVWAIGTGKTATPDMAADAHRHLRGLVRSTYGDDAASAVRILYGGSVKPDNVRALMAQPEIDGALVGGASLDAVSFASIVNF
jgi:triosephosphate isomerase